MKNFKGKSSCLEFILVSGLYQVCISLLRDLSLSYVFMLLLIDRKR